MVLKNETPQNIAPAWRTVLLLFVVHIITTFVSLFLVNPEMRLSPLRYYFTISVIEILFFFLPAFLYRKVRRYDCDYPVFRSKTHLSTVLAVIASASAHQPASQMVTVLFSRFALHFGFHLQSTEIPLPVTLIEGGTAVLAIALVPAFSEEILFRGVLLPGLKNGFSNTTAVFLTAVVFSLMHGTTAAIPAMLIVGYCISLLTVKTGSLLLSCVYHFAFNLFGLVWNTIPVIKTMSQKLTGLGSCVLIITVAVLFAGGIFLLFPKSRTHNKPAHLRPAITDVLMIGGFVLVLLFEHVGIMLFI